MGIALLGLGLGFAGGLLIGVLTGNLTQRRVDRTVRRVRAGRTEPTDSLRSVRDAFAADQELKLAPIQVVRGGADSIELRGWVDSRRIRARAYRTADRVAVDHRIINAVLVHGEDDLESPAPLSPIPETPRTA